MEMKLQIIECYIACPNEWGGMHGNNELLYRFEAECDLSKTNITCAASIATFVAMN